MNFKVINNQYGWPHPSDSRASCFVWFRAPHHTTEFSSHREVWSVRLAKISAASSRWITLNPDTDLIKPTGWTKNGTIFAHLIVLPNIKNINRFSQFYRQNQEKICNKI